MNNLENIVNSWINDSYQQRYGQFLSSHQSTLIWSAMAAIPHMGAVLSSLLINVAAEKLGRKRSLILVAGISSVSALLCGISKHVKTFELILVGRFGFGVAIGLGFGLSAMFVTEIPPIRYRGACGTCLQLLIGFRSRFRNQVFFAKIKLLSPKT